MPHLWKDGARRRVNVTPMGTSAAERAVRRVRPTWRACGGHALHHLSGGFRIPVSKRWLLCFRAGNAAPMLATKDVDFRQRTRAALHLDIQAGGRKCDSRVGLVRATLPNNILKGADRNVVLLVSCRCKPKKKLHRTCRGNNEQHLVGESAIASTRKHPIRWEASSRTVQREVVIAHHTAGYTQLVATTRSNVVSRGLAQVFNESRDPSKPALAQNKEHAPSR